MYQELLAKVDKVSYGAAVKMVMTLYPMCETKASWDPNNVTKYIECTNQISKSSHLIQKNIEDIESFSINGFRNMSAQTGLKQILEEIEHEPNPTKRLEHVIDYIRNVSSISNQFLNCSGMEKCLEDKREVIVRLKMIQWRLHGLGLRYL